MLFSIENILRANIEKMYEPGLTDLASQLSKMMKYSYADPMSQSKILGVMDLAKSFQRSQRQLHNPAYMSTFDILKDMASPKPQLFSLALHNTIQEIVQNQCKVTNQFDNIFKTLTFPKSFYDTISSLNNELVKSSNDYISMAAINSNEDLIAKFQESTEEVVQVNDEFISKGYITLEQFNAGVDRIFNAINELKTNTKNEQLISRLSLFMTTLGVILALLQFAIMFKSCDNKETDNNVSGTLSNENNNILLNPEDIQSSILKHYNESYKVKINQYIANIKSPIKRYPYKRSAVYTFICKSEKVLQINSYHKYHFVVYIDSCTGLSYSGFVPKKNFIAIEK